MNRVSRIPKILDHIYDLLFFLSGLLLAAIAIIISYEVFLRYVINRPTIWAIDLSRYILVYATFMGAIRCLKKNEHIAIDIVISRVSPKVQVPLNIFSSILGGLACLILFVFSAVTTWDHFRRGLHVIDPIEIPKFIPLAIIPIGAFFLFLVFVSKTFDYLFNLRIAGEKEENKK